MCSLVFTTQAATRVFALLASRVGMPSRKGIAHAFFRHIREHSRRRVINVARWESADNVKATQADPEAAELAARTAEIATPDPGIYVVAGEHTR